MDWCGENYKQLNFKRKYRINDSEDEIDELGKSINTLSDKLEETIRLLLKGATKEEKQKGIYSEIPANVDLISVKRLDKDIIIDLSSNFEKLIYASFALIPRFLGLIKETHCS